MTYVATGLIVLWGGGVLFFAGQALNDTRLIFNNLAPDPRYSESVPRSNSRIDPAKLTDIGRQHLRKAIRHERIMYAWIIAGLVLIAWYVSNIKT